MGDIKMADKMMRISGRADDGLAKAIKVGTDGDLIVQKPEVLFHMDEEGSYGGRDILAGQTWSSEVFDNLGNQTITIRTAPNNNTRYSIRLVELLKGKGETTIEYESHNVTSDSGSVRFFEVELTGKTKLFRIEVTNKGTITLKLGLIVQSSNTLKEYLANENTLQNIHNLTSEINDVSKDRFIQHMDEDGSYAGRDIEGLSEWESDVFNLNNNQKITLRTFLSIGVPYRIEIDELIRGRGGVTTLTTNTHKTDVFTSNQTIELMVQSSANMFKIRVINESEETFKFGLVVTSSPLNVISYYDGIQVKNQQEIATEKTLEQLLSAIQNSASPKQQKPILKNVKMIDPENVSANIVLGFHDGLFYGRNILKDNKLFTSEDGEVWNEFKTFNFSVNTNIEKFLASDTGRLIVGGENGEVFISDEDGSFGSSPSFTTGRLRRNFGKFKHENLIGFLCYDVHGFDSGQKHEAWLSINNGATFTKIFDNNTLQGLLTKYPEFNDARVHLHDIEYDPFSGRLYIWQGDFDSRTFYYSDDWGKTWEMGIPRGVVGNSTQIIAVPDGLVFGADTNGGGVAFLPLDRSKNIQPIIDINDYDNEHWKLNRDGERFVAVDKWVDRENSLYMLAYTVEFDDDQDRSGYLAYSRNGVDWDILMKSAHRGNFTGFENVAYGNGKLVCTYNFSKQYVLTADVTFDEG